MKATEWIQAIAGLVTALGVAAAGLWALYNFGLKRISAAQVQVNVEPTAIRSVGDGYVVHMSVTAANSGHTGVRKRLAFVELNTFNGQGNKSGIQRLTLSTSTPDTVYSVFDHHTFLEPGEVFREDLVFRVQAADYLQVRVVLFGTR